jgi:hypothetical protein
MKPKFYVMMSVLFGLTALSLGATLMWLMLVTPTITVNDVDVHVWAGVVKGTDGKDYRVEVADTNDTGPWRRIADAYSLDGTYAEITGIDKKSGAWVEVYSCSKEQLVAGVLCPKDEPGADVFLSDLVNKTTTRSNIIGNFEIWWSWQMETKDFVSKLR